MHAKRTQGQNYAQQAGGFSQHSRQPIWLKQQEAAVVIQRLGRYTDDAHLSSTHDPFFSEVILCHALRLFLFM